MVREGDFKLALQQACDMLSQNASRVSELLNSWDADHNGLISKKEFRVGCQMMGLLFPKEVLEALFEHFDEDDSGQLDHRELVMRARKASFARGFIPKNEAPKPTPARKLAIYWERRNRAHMEAHAQMLARREEVMNEHRRQRIDHRRSELQQTLRHKRDEAKQRALDRREIFWQKREREDRHKATVQRAMDAAREGEVHFLPALPEAKDRAMSTWARDPMRERTDDKMQAINDVSKLSDVWVGSIVKLWREPTQEQVLSEKLRAKQKAKQGYAPNAKHFKNIPLPQIGEGHAVRLEHPAAAPVSPQKSREPSRGRARASPSRGSRRATPGSRGLLGSQGRSNSDTFDLQASRSRPQVPSVATVAAGATVRTVAIDVPAARSYKVGKAEVLELP